MEIRGCITSGTIKNIKGYVLNIKGKELQSDCFVYDLKQVLDKYGIREFGVKNTTNRENEIIMDNLDINKNDEGIQLFKGIYFGF